MNDNEKNLSLKLSQYEMLDKTLRDIIEKNRDTSAIDDILRGIKETIEDITSIRETMENEKLDAIPRRKRTKRTSDESVKYVQQDLFSLDASEPFHQIRYDSPLVPCLRVGVEPFQVLVLVFFYCLFLVIAICGCNN